MRRQIEIGLLLIAWVVAILSWGAIERTKHPEYAAKDQHRIGLAKP